MTDKRWMKSMKYYVNFRQANLQMYIVTVAKTIHIQAHWHSGIISQLPVSLLSKKKCISVSSLTVTLYDIVLMLSLRNQAYDARIQFAYNNHHRRDLAKKKDGNYIYHRKYWKASKKWVTTATLESKKYQYIPPLLKAIHEEWSLSLHTTKSILLVPDCHPTKLQSTIAHTIPDTTTNFVKNKSSRFKWLFITILNNIYISLNMTWILLFSNSWSVFFKSHVVAIRCRETISYCPDDALHDVLCCPSIQLSTWSTDDRLIFCMLLVYM